MAGVDPSRVQAQIIRALLDPSRYPHEADRVEHLETHISHILLAGDRAYKIKKPVDLGFLDFSTLERRCFCCEEEIRLNRRLAPDYYLNTLAITGKPDDPVIGGPRESAIEFAVQMRRFPQNRLMDQRLADGLVTPEDLDPLADEVAGFHQRIDRTPPEGLGTPEAMHRAARENFLQLAPRVKNRKPIDILHDIERWTEESYESVRPVLATRAAEGWVRDCHGDLHLGNIALLDEGPLIFDCVEFAPALRWMDVQCEVAFVVMDLISHGRPDFAWRFMNRYLERTGDYAGLAAFQYFLAYRAMVRAKVAGIRVDQSQGAEARSARDVRDHYLELAQSFRRRRTPFLAIMHGLSGSGKSTVAGIVTELFGAIRLRSDVERKRMAGLALEGRSNSALDAGLYSDSAGERTYDRLRRLATAVLDSGYPLVVDATFLSRKRRREFLDLATDRGVRKLILTTHAPDRLLRQWLAERQAAGIDASEADQRVLDSQRRRAEALDASERAFECRIDMALFRNRDGMRSMLMPLLGDAG